MFPATQLKPGMTILYNGDPHKVMATEHRTPGKGQACMQTKLRNIITGLSTEARFRSDEKMEQARLDEEEVEYLYEADGEYFFMNTETYDQFSLQGETLGDAVKYMLPNSRITVQTFKGEHVGVVLPKVVELRIVDTAPNIKGATATSSYKPATMETGLVVNIPPFIESGTLIRIDTEDSSYIERAKE